MRTREVSWHRGSKKTRTTSPEIPKAEFLLTGNHQHFKISLLLQSYLNREIFHRDGVLFRYILDYLRNGSLILPENFQVHFEYRVIFLILIYLTAFKELDRLKIESKYFKLEDLNQQLETNKGNLWKQIFFSSLASGSSISIFYLENNQK